MTRFTSIFFRMLILIIIASSTLSAGAERPALQGRSLTVDDNCTLPDAITAANSDQPAGLCPAGNPGADVIFLSVDVTLSAAHHTGTHGPNGLPLITSEITIDGDGHIIERSPASGTPPFRLFEITPEGQLHLENVTLRGGMLQGGRGSAGSHSTTPGTDGEKGKFLLVAFFYVGEGNPGEDGGDGDMGGNGNPGKNAQGGAIYNAGEVTLEGVTLIDNQVIGGQGGRGGNGSDGGEGGEGGGVGKIAPVVVVAPPGKGGRGGAGGSGGTGGGGGHGQGGAIFNAGSILTIIGSNLSGNVAQGGGGNRGGTGGDAGPAGDSGTDGTTIGPGGDGGRGGSGGNGGNGGNSQGGAIYNDGGAVMLVNSTLDQNRVRGGLAGRGGAAGDGSNGGTEAGDGGLGGPGGYGGIGGNGQGGAIYQNDGTLIIDRTNLLDQMATGGNGGRGGNAGEAGDGGDLFIAFGQLTADETTVKLVFAFSGQEALGFDTGGPGGFGGFGGDSGTGNGGAIFHVAGELVITNSSLARNQSLGGEGGVGGTGTLGGYNSDALRDLYQWLIDQGWSEFRGLNPGENGSNGGPGATQEGYGGAMCACGGRFTIDASTLANNAAHQGGALWQDGEILPLPDAQGENETGGDTPASIITNSTIAGNTATEGGGIFVSPPSQAAPLGVGNTIVAANSATRGPDIHGTILSQGYNLIGNVADADLQGPNTRTLVDIDPLLAELDDHGGPTSTLALPLGSPAINRGRCTRATDQRGYYRVDAWCDIGAFEYGAQVVLPSPTPDAGTFVGANGGIRAALPAHVFARIIAADGVFNQNPGEIGVPAVLDRGVIGAVDIFTLDGRSAAGTYVCLRGTGDLIFLAASQRPRSPVSLATAAEADGYTCATLPGGGTLILVTSGP